jgi:ABC-type transporter Mla subunit MlaD
LDAENRPELELIVQQVGEAVLATTETVEHLSQHMAALANHVQQQGYQIFALSDAVQTLTEAHQESLKRLDRLTDVLERLVTAVEPSDRPPS